MFEFDWKVGDIFFNLCCFYLLYRSYYRCTSAACNVKKRVERSFADPTVVVTTYEGQHTHPSPILSRSALAVAIPPPSFIPGAGGECVGGVVAMPWLKPSNNDAHGSVCILTTFELYFEYFFLLLYI